MGIGLPLPTSERADEREHFPPWRLDAVPRNGADPTGRGRPFRSPRPCRRASAVTQPPTKAQAPRGKWRAWLGVLLLVPLTAASGGMLYGLYLHVVTGQLNTVASSYGTTSRTITFAESPVSFLVFFALHALLAAAVIFVTVVVARLSVRRLRGRT